MHLQLLLNVLSQISATEKNKFHYFLMGINRKCTKCDTSNMKENYILI